MIFPRIARYDRVMIKVNNLFLQENITSFPVDPFQIIKNNKWGLLTYSEIADEQGTWIEDIIAAFQSEDGYTIFDGTNYTIAYNDTIQNQGRIKFTLMHEIGHIYMDHLVDFDETVLMRSELTDKKYRVLENEANAFARNTLAPVMVVKALNLKTSADVADYFGLSQAAATVRLRSLIMDYRQLLSPFIRFQRVHFSQFIETVLYTKQCLICSHHFVDSEAEFCPVCGQNALLNKKGVFQMIYKGYFLDDNSRAVVCPFCENEHLNYEGEICIICGTNLVNKCAPTYVSGENGYNYLEESCEALLGGDARFCAKCGNESTYFQQRLLKDWKTEKEEIEQEKEMEELLF
jgi:Zn-dependent peptidase ImmA (M78 family)/RNA polymerase subunit RPABC4/transcription elongation factor Spt4